LQPIVRLYREARRRKVFRTAALYVLGSWAMLQVADVLFPGFGIPETAIQARVWAAVLGFPLALTFGWLFDVGPGGIRRTPALGMDESAEPQPLGKRDYLLFAAIVAVGAALILRAVHQISETPAPSSVASEAASGKAVERLPNSLAVLPFANISSDPDNEYFCDGISEEILNQIATVRELNAIGRTSSFAFKGSKASIEEISATLGVHYVLQGSVRKAGSRLRISAQLLDERGRQLWAETFDRELNNVFDIQQEIAQAVVARVAREMQPPPEGTRRPSLEAYDRYLAGRDLLYQRDTTGAMAALQRAIDLDPDFAEAHAEWAIARVMGPVSEHELELAGAAVDRALSLNPRLLRAQAARGLWYLQSIPPDAAAAEKALRAVVEQDPNMGDALNWLSIALRQLGQTDEALEMIARAYRIDPLHPSIAGNLARGLMETGDDAGALAVLNRQLQQPKAGYPIYWTLWDFYRLRGRLVELNAASKEISLSGTNTHLLLAVSYALLGDDAAAAHWLGRADAESPPDWPGHPFVRSLSPNWRGDAEQARQLFEQGVKSANIDLADQSDHFRVWYGALLARSSHYAEAIKWLEPLAVGTNTSQPLEVDIAPEFEGWHALAWSYQHVGEKSRAVAILSDRLEQCQTQFADRKHPANSNVVHLCAEAALLSGNPEQALAWLELAIKAGWRDYYVRRNDPYWASLDEDPRYRSLMATVKADIDRQRAEVERIDAKDGFEAKLDAMLASRKALSKN
jgi:TolB-like protein